MAGAGFKTFNTGDVLTASDVNTYLMQQTVMVFASAAARTTALGANVAEGMLSYLKDTDQVEVYNGTSWVASDDPNAIQNTIVDAKGDIITATANDTPARLAVGTNGQVLTADSSTATGLKWASAAGGFFKNPVLNSNFSVWQRGTSFTMSTTAYTADRWQGYRTVSGGTVSRQLTNDTTNLPNIQYCARVQRDSGNTSTAAALYLTQSFESVNSIPFAGKTVTLSFYARAGANYSPTSSALNVQLITGTGTDQNINGTYTGLAAPINTTSTLTTTWQRFSHTATLSSTMTEMGINFYLNPTGTAGANDYFEITGVQLEVGSSATDYYPNGNTYQAELAACQRYYWRITATGQSNTRHTIFAPAASTTDIRMNIQNPVPMRVTPTIVDYSSLITYDNAATGNAITPTIDPNSNSTVTTLTLTSSSLTQYRNYCALGNSTTSYLGLGAEL